MKNLISIFFITLLLISCSKLKPEGDIQQKQIPLENFSSIDAKGKFRIFWLKSDQNLLEIETYPNFIDNLNINIKDENLTISEKKETFGEGFYNITIFSKNTPSKITLRDSIEFNVSGQLALKNLKISLRDNSKFIGSLKSDRTEIEMQQSSLANFKGFTKQAQIKIKDTAGIIAPYWEISSLSIDAENGSYAEVNAQDSIKGNLKNTAKFVYYNNPIKVFKADKTVIIQNINLK
ncbi:MAG: GIN domain-containing protein [Bergeyella cardium]